MQTTYNDNAIAVAEELHELRKEQFAKRAANPLSPDQLFAFDRIGLGVAREYEAMGDQPVSDGVLVRAERFGASLEHLGLTIGTVIHDIDLNQLDDNKTQFIRDVLLERKVVFFRDQHLSEDEQVAFARRFGGLDAFPFGKPGTNPHILEIIHHEQSPGTENGWHTDVTWMESPSLGSVAQCVETPPFGGDTLFSDSYAAYRGLPAELSERVQGLHGINDYRIFLAGLRAGHLPDSLIDSIKSRIPFGVTHPLLRTHPETGKTALYIHGGFLRHDSLHNPQTGEQLEPAESKRIVAELLKQHARPEYTCRFQWQPGSIAFWDNRAAQHYAASDYFPHRRVLRRVTVSGDRPYFECPTQPA